MLKVIALGVLIDFRSFNYFFNTDLMKIKLKHISARDISIVFVFIFFFKVSVKCRLGWHNSFIQENIFAFSSYLGGKQKAFL